MNAVSNQDSITGSANSDSENGLTGTDLVEREREVPRLMRGQVLGRALSIPLHAMPAARAYPDQSRIQSVSSHIERVSNLEYRLSQFAGRARSSRELALEVLNGLRQLLIQETGTPDIEDALPIFARRYLMEPAMLRHFADILRDAERGIGMGSTPERFRSIVRVRSEIDQFIAWWQRRQESLIALEETEWQQGTATEFEQDSIFNVRVVHDYQWATLSGIAIQCGVFLRGRVTQPMWLKLTASSEGIPVSPRPGFEQWVDDGNGIGVTPSGFSIENPQPTVTRIAAVSCLASSLQKQIFDRVTLFLPYRALLLPEGNREIEFELGLFDEYGFPVCQKSLLETVSIPSRAFVDVHAPVAIPAPQRLGMWEEDPSTGSWIRINRVSETLSASDSSGAVQPLAHISFDLRLAHAGSLINNSTRLSIECRVVDERGSALAATDDRYRDRNGTFLVHYPLGAESAFTIRRDLTVSIPYSAFVLEGPLHSAPVFAEVSLVSDAGRVICGALSPLPVPTNPIPTQCVAARSLSIGEQHSGVWITNSGVSCGVSAIDASKERSIRGEIEFIDNTRTRSLVRAVMRVESADGTCLASTTVYVATDANSGHGSAVLRIPERTVQAMVPTAKVFPMRMTARLLILSLDQHVLAEKSTVIELNESSSGKEPASRNSSEGALVDVTRVTEGARAAPAISIVANIMPSVQMTRVPVLYVELARNQEVESRRVAPQPQINLAGRIVQIPMPEVAEGLSDGPLQVRIIVPLTDLSPDTLRNETYAATLSMLLFGLTGKLVQSIQLPLSQLQGTEGQSMPTQSKKSEDQRLGLSIADKIRRTFSTRSA